MYQVVSVLKGKEHALMDIRDEGYVISEPRLTLQVNNPGAFTFKIHASHPEIDSIVPLVSLVRIYRTDYSTYKKWMFTGRVTSNASDIYNTGTVKCEGILAYFMDSIVYPYEYGGTPADYVRQLIESHNSQVNPEKQFIVRTLDLSDADTNNNIVRANKNYPTTLQEIKDKVIKLLNAYISVEENEGKLYVDCNQGILHYNTQEIRLGENIIDLKQTKSAGEIRTVMIGIGAEDDEGNTPTVTVENDAAIAKYGRIVGTVEFENVTTMSQLEKKTKAYLDGIIAETNAVEIKAVDLNMTSAEIERIELGYCYVTSEYHHLARTRMLVSKMEIWLAQPEKNTFSLGASVKSMTTGTSHINAAIEARVKRVAASMNPKIEMAVENATQLITGAKGGYVILDCGDNADRHPEQILIMDSPEKETAKNVIRINKNGLGFSTTGYDGPYRNAWTIDGNLVADFITAGTMFADRISGGTLALGGDGNVNGKMVIKDSDGDIKITIDANGINVNDKYKIDMNGNMEAISISGDAIDQINDIIDNSLAMKTAKKAIGKAQAAASTAQNAADTAKQAADKAQETAEIANGAANTANNAAAAAKTAADEAKAAADKAQKAIDALAITVTNLNSMVDQINTWIKQIDAQLKELGKPGIS